MFCSNCGAQNPDESVFCMSCGAKLIRPGMQEIPQEPQQFRQEPHAFQQEPQPEAPRSGGQRPPRKKNNPVVKTKKTMRIVIIAAIAFAAAMVLLALFDPFGWFGKKGESASGDGNSVFAQVNQNDLLYTYAVKEVNLLQEVFRMQGEITGEAPEESIASLLSLSEPKSVQRIDFGNPDAVWQAQSGLDETAADSEEVRAYLRNASVSGLTSYLMMKNIDAGVSTANISTLLRSDGFQYDGLDTPAAMVLSYPDDVTVFAAFTPSSALTTGISVIPVFGDAAEELSADPAGFIENSDIFENANAEISVEELETPQYLESLPQADMQNYEAEQLARELTTELLDKYVTSGMLKDIYVQNGDAAGQLQTYEGASYEIRNIYVFDMDTSLSAYQEDIEESGIDLDSISPEIRNWIYSGLMQEAAYSEASSSTDIAVRSICRIGKYYAGHLTYFTTAPVNGPQICIVDCGEELPPVLVLLSEDTGRSVIGATVMLCPGTDVVGLYSAYDEIADCPVPCPEETYSGPDVGTGTAIVTPDPTPTPEPTSEPMPEPVSEDVVETVEMDHQYSGGKEYGVITGRNAAGEAVWSIQTGQYDAAQLDRVGELGRNIDSYYYYEDGSVICLDIQTGTPVWINEEFGGASASADIMDSGRVYLCGYFGPALMVIDGDGSTVQRIDDFNGYMWYHGIEKIGGDELVLKATEEGASMKDVKLHIETVKYSIIFTE